MALGAKATSVGKLVLRAWLRVWLLLWRRDALAKRFFTGCQAPIQHRSRWRPVSSRSLRYQQRSFRHSGRFGSTLSCAALRLARQIAMLLPGCVRE